MIERAHQTDVPTEEHSVAEHVSAHVADAYRREILGLRVNPEFAEVPLDAFPGAASGDTHALVVVSHGATGGKRVAEPEVVLGGNRIGEIRERRRALVRGDHQVAILIVLAHHSIRRHNFAGSRVHVVGDVEQSGDERGVAGLAGFQRRHSINGRIARRQRRILHDEAALGADRHDHRVLDGLSLHQAEHLGAEILAPVGPAEPAARDCAESQVDAFDLG